MSYNGKRDELTSVELMERKVNKHLRKWLGVPPSFTSLGLYSKSGQMQLPLASVVEEYKVAKCRTVMLYRDSQDQQVRQAGVITRAGHKFKADSLVSKAEGILILRDIVGITNTGRQGPGSSHFQQWGKASRRERRGLIQTKVRHLEEEGRRAKAAQLAAQGAWKISWWGLREDPACKLGGERGTMAHILSGCKTALTQGRYRWRHDKVLTTIASILEVERKKKRNVETRRGPVTTFVRGGGSRPATAGNSILQKAKSWDLRVDLGRRLHFPSVVHTRLRPDAVLWSEEGKKIVLIELTVPWEERCEEEYERKKNKYQDLLQECRDKGWQAWLFPIEIGCRGFPAQSVWKMMTALGIAGKDRKAAIRRMGEAA
ncbi:uncharacterized protein [Branchiostoma lanceolatum]|uniref:uncharacterized protein n=1 Tax=Branchiostoma lanceolatum TaxID=7740 RepID=UPI003455DF5B